MGIDRAFVTPTITVDQEKYDKLIIMSSRYREMTKKQDEKRMYLILEKQFNI